MLGVLMFLLVQTEADTVYNLRDFRLPDVGVMRLSVDGSFSVKGADDLYESEDPEYSIHSKDIYGSSSGSISWDLRLLGEQRYFDVKINPGLNGHSGAYTGEYKEDTLYSTDTAKYFDQGTFLAIVSDGGWYLGQSPFFIGYREGFRADQKLCLSDVYVDTSFLTANGYLYLNVGVGKIRDVTPAANAWYFLEELGYANYDDIESLGKLLASQWSYELKHWRYEKFFYADAENLLIEEGVVPRLSAYEVMRLREIVASFPSRRLYGTRFTLGVGWRLPQEPAIRVVLEAAYPISRRWQFNFCGRSFLEIPGVDRDSLGYTISGTTSLSYYVGELWKISSSLEGEFFDGPSYYVGYEEKDISVSFIPIGVNWYLDDRLDLNTELSYSFRRREREPNRMLDVEHSFRLNVGLTWRLR